MHRKWIHMRADRCAFWYKVGGDISATDTMVQGCQYSTAMPQQIHALHYSESRHHLFAKMLRTLHGTSGYIELFELSQHRVSFKASGSNTTPTTNVHTNLGHKCGNI